MNDLIIKICGMREQADLDCAAALGVNLCGFIFAPQSPRAVTPEQAAGEIVPLLHEGNRVAIVFGCEDRGLSNADIEQCQRLVTIPTAGEASSLNLAQAILILTYECMKAVSRVDPQPSLGNDPGQQSRRITHEEQALLYARLKETLLAIDYLKSDNPDYFLMPLRRFLGKSGLRRHEMDMLMGICRQVDNLRKANGNG